MTQWLLHLLLFTGSGTIYSSESDVLHEIKTLREETAHEIKILRDDMTREIRTLREDTTREMTTLREDMSQRFQQFMWFLGLWVPVSMAMVSYIFQRLSKHEDLIFQISADKNKTDLDQFIAALRKANPQTRKRRKEILRG